MEETDEEEDNTPLPSVKMGAWDLPLHALNFFTGTLHLAAAVVGDITLTVAKHANYRRDMSEFDEMVKRYDYSSAIGVRAGLLEPTDRHEPDAEDQGTP